MLITGGSGQIGSFLCRSLLRSNEQVVIYDVKPNLENIQDFRDRVTLVEGDILDRDQMVETIRKHDVRTVFHLAAVVVLESRENPVKSASVNCLGTANVLEASRQTSVERVVFTSSSAVMGRPESYLKSIVSEDDIPRCPPDPYSATKVMNEVFGQHYYARFGLKTLCLRIAAGWGPGRYVGFTGVFNDMIRKVARGAPATLPPDFSYPRAPLRWVFVEELGDCLAYAGRVEEAKVKRRLYNVGTRTPFTPVDFIDALRRIVPDAKLQVEWRDRPTESALNVAGPSGLDFDCTRFYDELGYRERLGLVESLERAVALERALGGRVDSPDR
ncbi:MAG: NAD-dependent epimerase/dehydratase family protein [Nitrososphaerales archaeon]